MLEAVYILVWLEGQISRFLYYPEVLISERKDAAEAQQQAQ